MICMQGESPRGTVETLSAKLIASGIVSGALYLLLYLYEREIMAAFTRTDGWYPALPVARGVRVFVRPWRLHRLFLGSARRQGRAEKVADGARQQSSSSICSHGNVLALLAIGFVGGLVSGFIGSGGAFVLTPAMMSMGVPGVVAVASNLCHKFPKALVGAYQRNKFGQVDVKLGLVMAASAAVGVWVGADIQHAIKRGLRRGRIESVREPRVRRSC